MSPPPTRFARRLEGASAADRQSRLRAARWMPRGVAND